MSQGEAHTPAAHHSENKPTTFKCVETRDIASLGLTMSIYRHQITGALHVHLDAEDQENVFLVALRTMPMDDAGVAHILEHTALCGSERYPVRDPFFMMIRRSLNTFMNAFTSSDWTAYPFASKNKKDFENLLGVYLDAVFFSRLDPLDFAQEGHRLAFANPEDSSSALTYQGVVFNEMKGAMSSPVSVLWQYLSHHLYPTSTYHYNSGGEPAAIPDLSYKQLQAFYQHHYHPSNAVFMTYGDLPAGWHQDHFEKSVLSRFDRGDDNIAVAPEKRYSEPKQVMEHYALDSQDQQTYHVVAWLLHDVTDVMALIQTYFLSRVLLDHSASPLMHVLETSEYGTGPAPIIGVLDDAYEVAFACGIEGSEADDAAAVETLILETLRLIADQGIAQSECESALRQLELEQREVGGGSYPYGLQLMLRSLPGAIHHGDPLGFLDVDAKLRDMRELIKQDNFVSDLIHKNLLDNPHRLRLTMTPDTQLAAKTLKQEQQKLADIKAGLSQEDMQAIVDQSQALSDRQTMEEDLSILPEVTPKDVPAVWALAKGDVHTSACGDIHHYAQPCNGIVYQDAVLQMPSLSQWQSLTWFNACFTEMGCGTLDYQAMQARQYHESGGVSSLVSVVTDIEDASQAKMYFALMGKALNAQSEELANLLADMLANTSFDDPDRIKDILLQHTQSQYRSITGSGHVLAMLAASAVHCKSSSLRHHLFGLKHIAKTLQLSQQLDQKLPELTETFTAMHQALSQASKTYFVVNDAQQLPQQLSIIEQTMAVSTDTAWATMDDSLIEVPQKQLWIVDSQVNFCAKSYPTVGYDHSDCAPLMVLALILRNGYCHRAIREQGGAYGGGAVQSPGDHSLRFYSYRDPRLQETLADFDRAIDWVNDKRITQSLLNEAILGIISQIDKPSSPAGEARKSFYSTYEGRSEAMQQQRRDRVLSVTLNDVYRVSQAYLHPEKASTAVISSAEVLAEHGDMGMSVTQIKEDS